MAKIRNWSKVEENFWRNDVTGAEIGIVNYGNDKYEVVWQDRYRGGINMGVHSTLGKAQKHAINYMKNKPFGGKFPKGGFPLR